MSEVRDNKNVAYVKISPITKEHALYNRSNYIIYSTDVIICIYTLSTYGYNIGITFTVKSSSHISGWIWIWIYKTKTSS